MIRALSSDFAFRLHSTYRLVECCMLAGWPAIQPCYYIILIDLLRLDYVYDYCSPFRCTAVRDVDWLIFYCTLADWSARVLI